MDELLLKSNALQNLIQRSLPADPLHKWVERHPVASALATAISGLLPQVIAVYEPSQVRAPDLSKPFRAVAWNIDRGKKTDEVVRCLQTHPQLREADFILLTETDWGMARSGNRNVTADIAAALNMHAWFAPAYLNLTAGHGAERVMGGQNDYGLHGNSLLSRYPLSNLRVVKLKNATDKFRSKEVRLGQQTALVADLVAGDRCVTLGCVHLDAYSSQRQRALQLREILRALPSQGPVIIGGDFNTSTYNVRHTVFTALGLIYKTLFFGPNRIMRNHYLHPYKRFDRPVFRELERCGMDYRRCNELGVGTFDIVLGDEAMRAMASDKFPRFVQHYVEWAVGLNGGGCSTRLDWFAAKNITPIESRVIRLSEATQNAIEYRISDHHPIMVEFQI